MPQLFIVYLENGWGNMILELAAGLAIAKTTEKKDDENQIIGFLSQSFFSTHRTVFLNEHLQKKLPALHDMQSIFPNTMFISASHCDTNLEIPSNFSSYEKILLRVDWMNNNAQLLLPALSQNPELLNYLKPSSTILEYINEKYIGTTPQNTVTIHVRVRQPGDIMANMKHPNPQWFVDAINLIKLDQLERIILISGISTAHSDGKKYLGSIIETLSLSFPKVKIIIMQNEPCYIDFFTLSSMPNLVITNSSFSFMAALLGSAWKQCSKIILPDCLLNEFDVKLNDIPFPSFNCLPVKNPILAFQSS